MSYLDQKSLTATVGAATFWAWLDSVSFAVTMTRASPVPPVSVHTTLLIALCCGSIVATIVLCRVRILYELCSRPATMPVLTGLGCLGVILSLAAAHLGLPILSIISALCNSLPMALMPMLWGRVYMEDADGRGAGWIAGSIFLGTVLHLLAVNLLDVLGVALILLFLPVSALLYVRVLRLSPADSKPYHKEKRSPELRRGVRFIARSQFPLRLFFGLIVFSFAFGIVEYLNDTDAIEDFRTIKQIAIAGRCLVALILYVLISIFNRNTRIIYRAGFLLMIAGFLVEPFFFAKIPLYLSSLVSIGYACFEIMVWAIVFQLVRRKLYNPLESIVMARLLTMGGILFGALSGTMLKGSLMSDVQQLSVVMTAIAYILITTMVIVLDDGGKSGFWSLLNPVSERNPVETLEDRCELMAKRFRLTAREHEVLLYLAKGRTAPYIADKLSVADVTVNFHIHNIYDKMGIHTRQGLLDFFDSLEVEA
ncbi:MAG: helix-turn-helix transcriptional regulator [Coriobacteriales bacterium]|nr:helix-turn-helix transcriptional regulator [Coriobacteriales bacterium]